MIKFYFNKENLNSNLIQKQKKTEWMIRTIVSVMFMLNDFPKEKIDCFMVKVFDDVRVDRIIQFYLFNLIKLI